MKWLDDITDSRDMSLSELQELVMDRQASSLEPSERITLLTLDFRPSAFTTVRE